LEVAEGSLPTPVPTESRAPKARPEARLEAWPSERLDELGGSAASRGAVGEPEQETLADELTEVRADGKWDCAALAVGDNVKVVEALARACPETRGVKLRIARFKDATHAYCYSRPPFPAMKRRIRVQHLLAWTEEDERATHEDTREALVRDVARASAGLPI